MRPRPRNTGGSAHALFAVVLVLTVLTAVPIDRFTAHFVHFFSSVPQSVVAQVQPVGSSSRRSSSVPMSAAPSSAPTPSSVPHPSSAAQSSPSPPSSAPVTSASSSMPAASAIASQPASSPASSSASSAIAQQSSSSPPSSTPPSSGAASTAPSSHMAASSSPSSAPPSSASASSSSHPASTSSTSAAAMSSSSATDVQPAASETPVEPSSEGAVQGGSNGPLSSAGPGTAGSDTSDSSAGEWTSDAVSPSSGPEAPASPSSITQSTLSSAELPPTTPTPSSSAWTLERLFQQWRAPLAPSSPASPPPPVYADPTPTQLHDIITQHLPPATQTLVEELPTQPSLSVDEKAQARSAVASLEAALSAQREHVAGVLMRLVLPQPIVSEFFGLDRINIHHLLPEDLPRALVELERRVPLLSPLQMRDRLKQIYTVLAQHAIDIPSAVAVAATALIPDRGDILKSADMLIALRDAILNAGVSLSPLAQSMAAVNVDAQTLLRLLPTALAQPQATNGDAVRGLLRSIESATHRTTANVIALVETIDQALNQLGPVSAHDSASVAAESLVDGIAQTTGYRYDERDPARFFLSVRHGVPSAAAEAFERADLVSERRILRQTLTESRDVQYQLEVCRSHGKTEIVDAYDHLLRAIDDTQDQAAILLTSQRVQEYLRTLDEAAAAGSLPKRITWHTQNILWRLFGLTF